MSQVRGISDHELLRAVLSGAPVRIGVLDRKGRSVLEPDPNPPLANDDGAVRGASVLEFYGDVPGALEALRACFAGETVHITRQFGGANYSASFLPRRGGNGEVDSIFAIATVVAEDRLIERALAELQTRERRLFSSSMVGLFYWTEDGSITDANDAFLAMVGYTRAGIEQEQLNWQAMTPPEYRPLDERALDQVRASGSCVPYEKQYVRADGQRTDVLVGASGWELGTMGGVAFVVDISERKRSERVRLEAEETLRRVVDAVPVVLWSIDVHGVFTLSTGRGLRPLGLEPGQVVGLSVFDVYADAPLVLDCIKRSLAGEEVFETIVIAGLVFESSFTPLHDQEGRVNGVLGVAVDVTERKRVEREREKLRMQLLQVQKLESLGLLAGGIAHDFNNTLTPILGASSTALQMLPRDSPARPCLELVVAAAQRAASLTRQMLAYSGKARVEAGALDLSRHVREITGLLETSVSKKVQLRLELAADLPPVQADVAQLQQVVMNLVINAAEAIGDQVGSVVVSTGTQQLDATQRASSFAAEGLRPGEYVFLVVEDTGPGMDEKTQQKIFDPFFTTKFTGRGLGLAAVLGIVRAHHGTIQVHSTPGLGTRIKVLLPASVQAAAPDSTRTTHDYHGEGLVLVIDDDRSVRSTVRIILEEFGFRVIEAADGYAGARTFAERAPEIALVLLDMMMPRMNGEETLRAIREVRTDVPVLMMSGYNEIDAGGSLASDELASFLEKPFTPARLVGKLQAMVRPRRVDAASARSGTAHCTRS